MEGKKVLIIDDEGYICDLVVDFLALENMTGIKSGEFGTALELMKDESFDLIISDVNIGNDRVEEFISELRNRHIDTPVALMTGDHRIDEDFVSRAGAVGIIHKPFQVAPFLDSVHRFLEIS